MTADPDATDAAATTAAEPDGGGPGADSTPERLLRLQELDAESDHIRLRRDRLPEREQVATRSGQLAAWERRRTELRGRTDELSSTVDAVEQRDGALLADSRRLEAQLKTVIAPREAEALMSEIATIGEQRDDLETRELEALTEMESIDEQLAAHLLEEASLRDGLRLADEALAIAVADLDRELDGLAVRRDEVRSTLDPVILADYDRVRDRLGVAVARLAGWRCDGCHLDLSAAEVDTAKGDAEGTGITDCPHCGRMLVV